MIDSRDFLAAKKRSADWEGVSASVLEGLDEMLTLAGLGLQAELRRSLACANIIENLMSTVRRVCRNVKYWRSPSMALRWTGGRAPPAGGRQGLQAPQGP
jgi:putative transposase